MFDPNANAPVFNQMPPVVVLLTLVIALAEVVFQLGAAGIIGGPQAIGWRVSIAQDYAFSNNAALWMWETGRYPVEHLLRFVTYPFVHTGLMDTLFSCVFVLALGKFVGERVHWLIFLVIFFASGALAAGLYAAIIGPNGALIGAGPGSYGLIGAFTWILVGDFRDNGQGVLRAFRLIFALALIHLLFWVMFRDNVWFSRFIGFGAGFAICAVLRPKEARGFGYIVEQLRNRR